MAKGSIYNYTHQFWDTCDSSIDPVRDDGCHVTPKGTAYEVHPDNPDLYKSAQSD